MEDNKGLLDEVLINALLFIILHGIDVYNDTLELCKSLYMETDNSDKVVNDD